VTDYLLSTYRLVFLFSPLLFLAAVHLEDCSLGVELFLRKEMGEQCGCGVFWDQR